MALLRFLHVQKRAEQTRQAIGTFERVGEELTRALENCPEAARQRLNEMIALNRETLGVLKQTLESVQKELERHPHPELVRESLKRGLESDGQSR